MTPSPPEDPPALPPPNQREIVRRRYASIAGAEAAAAGGCCDPPTAGSGCCAPSGAGSAGTDDGASSLAAHSRRLGYSDADLDAVDTASNLGLGCGNPTAIADLHEGETVLDLGSGGGFDCFLAARAVGEHGSVIGVDMTPEMVERARATQAEHGPPNVGFRLGEIEHLPVPDAHVDVIISNCVINLSPHKDRVFEEAYRVLRPGGRLAVADVVLTAEVPAEARADPADLAGCVAGAATVPELERLLADAGFASVSVRPKDESAAFIREWSAAIPLEEYIVSAAVTARKPGAPGA